MKREKKTRHKSTSRQKAIKVADKAFADYIKSRDRRCVTCGNTDGLDCSHVFRRSHFALRWHRDNAYAQCRGCHFKHHNVSEYPLIEYAIKKLGPERVKRLEEMSHEITKITVGDIQYVADYFGELSRNMMEKI